MGWEARLNADSPPRGNPKKVLMGGGSILVSGRTAVRWRKLKRTEEVPAPWARDIDPVRQP